jgi:acyl dehydratase/acyl-CoA thioesterase FadM
MTGNAAPEKLEAHVDNASVSNLAKCIDWKSPAVPPTWPITLLAHSKTASILAHHCSQSGLFPVHVTQSFRYRRPLPMQTKLACEASLAGLDTGRCKLNLRVGATSGELICEASSSLVLVRDLSPISNPASATRLPAGMATKASASTPVLTVDLFKAYMDASGDVNPIHHEEAAAMSLGFEEPIAPGMLIAGMMTSFLSQMLKQPGVSRLDAVFVAPVLAGCKLTFTLSEAVASGRYQLFATDEDGRLCVRMTAVIA